MSLLQEAMEKCTLIDRATVTDGLGGFLSEWRDGAEIQAAIVFNGSLEAQRAAVEGVTALYTVTTSRSITLRYHDVFRRESDGKIFRVTSDGDDLKTPKSAMLDMRNVKAEEWELPRD